NETLESEFNCHRRELIQQNASSDIGRWSAELRHYLSDLPADVTKNTDIMQWWAKHTKVYPTLACIARDVCAIAATSVPSGAEIATNRRSCLGSDKFKQLQMLKHMWCGGIHDFAALNSSAMEEVELEEFKELLVHDLEMLEWDSRVETVFA
ncbi:hypothetical protein SCLCIDRAFT_112526, partial [Scleroderma citrinum Foug A]